MAYNSKFTGAQIDDLLEKSKTMGATVDGLAKDVAVKEDAANKVTSITASADDTHYPSAKAVKTALTHLADGEDLASVGNVMKLADKAYTPTTYSGMGRKYLRKNLVGGKNILTQEMLPSANTIYIIQYDYDLNGETITIPENCTLDFQGGSLGNGAVIFSNTELIGTPRIYTNFGGVIANDTIHTKWFINLPDDADCSQTLRRIVKLAYTSSVNSSSSGWKMCKAIHIDAGIYTVKNSLIDSSLGVIAGRFDVTGDGYVNTRINYDNSDVALIDNQQIFGFSKFEGINFVANNNSTFANLVGGGSGNSQSIVFENCSFQKWTTILNSSGGTMNSEITFTNCKINSCGNTENKCMLFILNNPQAVNWRFIATDIESCFGTYFEAIQGFNISIYQGSMIPYSGDKDNPSIFLHIPTNAIPDSFGPNNAPNLIVNQSRFELGRYTHLIKQDANVVYECVFNNVGLGGYTLTTDEDFYTLYLIGRSVIKFNDCENFSNYKLYHRGHNSSDISALIYANTSLFNYLLTNSKEETYSGSNVWGYCYFHNIDTGEVSVSRSKSNPKTFCVNHNANEVTTTYSTSAESNTLAIYSGHSETINIVKPMILTDVTISHIGSPAYGGTIVSYKVTTLDVNGNDVDTIMVASNDNRASRKMSAFIRKATPVYGIRIVISDNFSGTAAMVVRGLISYSHY